MSALAQVRAAVRADLEQIEPGDSVVSAISGGADSLALTAALVQEAPMRAIRVIGLSVDHGLQEGSGDRAKALITSIEPALQHGEVLTVDVIGAGGLEAAARRARYQALTEAADRLGAHWIYLGHTAGDQAEGVLLGLARGSGARSLSGMARVSGRIRRPLLQVPRDVVRAAGAQNPWGIPPWEDPHNTDPRFLRARVRSRVLPLLESELGPGVGEALIRSARLLREDADALDALAHAAMHVDGGQLELGPVVGLHRAIRTRVVLSFLREGGVADLSAQHIDRVDDLIDQWRGQGAVALPGGATVHREGLRLILTPGSRST